MPLRGKLAAFGLSATLAVGLVTATAGTALATHCNTLRMCGYDNRDYVHPQWAYQGGTGTVYSLTTATGRDQIESGKNRTSQKWCGVNEKLFGDATVAIWNATTNIRDIGSGARNMIDHFDIRAASGNCVV